MSSTIRTPAMSWIRLSYTTCWDLTLLGMTSSGQPARHGTMIANGATWATSLVGANVSARSLN
ncbi:MAG: hypothetical protein ACYCYF_08565 [Anaerolineae bacterium]